MRTYVRTYVGGKVSTRYFQIHLSGRVRFSLFGDERKPVRSIRPRVCVILYVSRQPIQSALLVLTNNKMMVSAATAKTLS